MQIYNNTHLCYSLNVYPGKNWDERLTLLKDKIPLIKNNITGVSQDTPFALGLWLDNNSVKQLIQSPKLIEESKQFFKENNYYVFTVNAFPFGVFHDESVKENVYKPDWTTLGRTQYTCQVADVLAELLPENVTGSISTLPGSYKDWITTPKQLKDIADNLLKTAKHLKELESQTGKKIVLGIEMEPDCLWESPQEFIAFYKEFIAPEKELAKYIGVCYDTCHQELINNETYDGLQMLFDADITIAKIQLSSAILAPTLKSKQSLETFKDNVYLHQTRSSEFKYKDLPDAIANADKLTPWVTHFHIPVYYQTLFGELEPANKELTEVLAIIKKYPELFPHLEIETYTYSVLPDDLKQTSLEKSIAQEYNYILNKLGQ